MFDSPDIVPGQGDVRDHWRQINEARDAARRLAGAHGESESYVANLRRRFSMGSLDMFPFKVYLAQLAYSQNNNPTADQTTWWRTFLVRGGYVGSDQLDGDGTDGFGDDAFSNYVPGEQSDDGSGQPLQPITAPPGTANFYIWIELTANDGPQLRNGTDPTTTDGDVLNPWDNFPTPDGLHFLIATIDTNTNAGTLGPAIITQWLDSHIPPGLPVQACDETGAALDLVLPFVMQASPPN